MPNLIASRIVRAVAERHEKNHNLYVRIWKNDVLVKTEKIGYVEAFGSTIECHPVDSNGSYFVFRLRDDGAGITVQLDDGRLLELCSEEDDGSFIVVPDARECEQMRRVGHVTLKGRTALGGKTAKLVFRVNRVISPWEVEAELVSADGLQLGYQKTEELAELFQNTRFTLSYRKSGPTLAYSALGEALLACSHGVFTTYIPEE